MGCSRLRGARTAPNARNRPSFKKQRPKRRKNVEKRSKQLNLRSPCVSTQRPQPWHCLLEAEPETFLQRKGLSRRGARSSTSGGRRRSRRAGGGQPVPFLRRKHFLRTRARTRNRSGGRSRAVEPKELIMIEARGIITDVDDTTAKQVVGAGQSLRQTEKR